MFAQGGIHTNTVEGYYSIFKRGMKGVYQHCAEKHLHRYLAEFDFRYSNRVALGVNDEMRAGRALKGIAGKRLDLPRLNYFFSPPPSLASASLTRVSVATSPLTCVPSGCGSE